LKRRNLPSMLPRILVSVQVFCVTLFCILRVRKLLFSSYDTATPEIPRPVGFSPLAWKLNSISFDPYYFGVAKASGLVVNVLSNGTSLPRGFAPIRSIDR
jgi:hypothetical protein